MELTKYLNLWRIQIHDQGSVKELIHVIRDKCLIQSDIHTCSPSQVTGQGLKSSDVQ